MTDGVRLSVVIPAYCEGKAAAVAVTRVRAELAAIVDGGGLEVIVVDDGSPDDTAEQARAAGADLVLRNPVNRGKGAAVRAGVLAASGRAIAYTDADLSYDPSQLARLLEVVEQGTEMVVGSRRHVDTTTLVRARRLREVSGRAFNIATRWLLLGEERDTQCGLKAFRHEAARALFRAQRLDGFAFDVELFFVAERLGLSIVEVPVTVAHTTHSTVRVGGDALRMLRDLVRVRWWAARGLYPGRH
ncbi:MAG TPA: glycosyltransferase [Acidimicrobiales bacterium]|nr:glycosyltransferase [Acidimicrobiales bacterium]